MSTPLESGIYGRRCIVVSDEDPAAVAFILETLRADGHAVFHAYDVLSATQLAHALHPCDLLISNTKVAGGEGVDLILQLRQARPNLPIIYLANTGRSAPEGKHQLRPDASIIRKPFTAEKIRAAVNAKLAERASAEKNRLTA